jgi:hypothetical protein
MFRAILLAALSATSLSSSACPTLTGSYRCTHEDGSIDQMWIAQERKNGLDLYSFNGSDMGADNVKHEIAGDPSFRNGSLRAWCEEDVFKSEMTGEYYQDESKTGEVDVIMDISIKENLLIEIASGTMKSKYGEFPINGLVSCRRESTTASN